jgi:hypothetical protein
MMFRFEKIYEVPFKLLELDWYEQELNSSGSFCCTITIQSLIDIRLVISEILHEKRRKESPTNMRSL